MILDSIDNVKHYRNLSESIKKAFEFIEEIDFSTIEPGRYNVDGDNIFALVSEYYTKPLPEARPEAHEQYLDIQYMISGSEIIGYSLLEDQNVAVPYDVEKDLVFYKSNLDVVTLKEGMFAVFFPNEIHAPGLTDDAPEQVKKVVVKVMI